MINSHKISSSPTVIPVVGDLIKVKWKMQIENEDSNDNVRWMKARVIEIRKSKKSKHGSEYKYKLEFLQELNNDKNNKLMNVSDLPSVETRLLHKEYSIINTENNFENTNKKRDLDSINSDCDINIIKKEESGQRITKKSKKNKSNIHPETDLKSTGATQHLPPHRFILAPMVGGSELAFRLLCRKYGVQLAYTPMMSSERFAIDEMYRQEEFQTCPEDRPLVAHFSANNPQTLLKAAKHIEHLCDAIDLNLGCPQRIAHSGHFGSYLLGAEDRSLVLDIVKTVSSGISIPLFVKIRLLDTVEESVQLCQELAEAGAALIAVHGRYRVNLVGRSGPGARDGPAHLDQIKVIKEAIKSIPIIANGNVITYNDVIQNLELTGADGIMSAEGILDNPTLFSGHDDESQTLSTEKSNSSVALEYIELVEKYPVKLKSVIFHVRRICKNEFEKYQLLEDCLTSETVAEVKRVIQLANDYSNGILKFNFDPYKEKRRKEILARKKIEEGKRKAYEDRMVRKAKREGRDINHYLNIGAKNPTVEILAQLKSLSKKEAFDIWKIDHSQHCYAHHLEAGGCPRDRTCAFLHSDVTVAEAVIYG